MIFPPSLDFPYQKNTLQARSRFVLQRFWKSYCHSERSLSIARRKKGSLSCFSRQLEPGTETLQALLCHLGRGGGLAHRPHLRGHDHDHKEDLDLMPMFACPHRGPTPRGVGAGGGPTGTLDPDIMIVLGPAQGSRGARLGQVGFGSLCGAQ